MNYLKQVQRGIDYIEANLDYDIALEKVSIEAGISFWHFQRIFKALTNETLKTYIRSRRLSKSIEKLLYTKESILSIAIWAGYNSQESFTRAFKKAFNLNPNEFRKIGDKNMFLKKIQFDSDYLLHINKNISLQPRIYDQNEMMMIGMRTTFYSVDSEKNNIGEKLPPLWGNFMNRVNEISFRIPHVCYGIIRQTQENSDLLEYYAAVEVHKIENIPPAMFSTQLAQSTYAEFTHKGEAKEIDKTVNYIYSSWLLQSGKRHNYGADMEIYGKDYKPGPHGIIRYAIPIQ